MADPVVATAPAPAATPATATTAVTPAIVTATVPAAAAPATLVVEAAPKTGDALKPGPAPVIEKGLLADPAKEAETKAAEAKKLADEKAAADLKKTSVPEKYELKIEKGVLLSQADAEKIAAVYRAQGFSQDQAAAAWKAHNEMMGAYVESQVKALREQINEGYKQIVADKNYGGDKLVESNELATRTLERFGSPELMRKLKESGYSRDPDVFRFIVNVGRGFKEDTLVQPGAQRGPQKDRLQKMFPSMFPAQKESEA